MASAIHCGKLPVDRVPTYDEITALPYYDHTAPEKIGTPYYVGRDDWGNEIYCIGFWSYRKPLVLVLRFLLLHLEVPEDDCRFIDAFTLINFSTKLGGALSKRFKMGTIGRRLSVWGIQRRYDGFVALVRAVKQTLGR